MIHVEQQWAENVHTAVGKLFEKQEKSCKITEGSENEMHQKVHDPYLTEKKKDTILAQIKQTRALPVSSRKLWEVSGECDLVEFHKCEDGIRLHGHRECILFIIGRIQKGKEKSTDADRLQLVYFGFMSRRNVLQQYLKHFLFMEKQDEDLEMQRI